jgi:hypothetical protein
MSGFFKKFLSKHLWGNLLAMALIVVLLFWGITYAMQLYTYHGRSVEMPDIVHKTFDQAEATLDSLDLSIEVSDTGYIKTLPPDCILEQSISAGEVIKPGRVIYVKINSAHSPLKAIPDIADNSSLRDAIYQLETIGFKRIGVESVPGEYDWVYRVKSRHRMLNPGDMRSTEDTLSLEVGDGSRDQSIEVQMTEAPVDQFNDDDDEVKRPRPKPKKTEEGEGERHQESPAPAAAPAPQPAAPAPAN